MIFLEELIIGDAVLNGEYSLHSAFEKVCNFSCDEKLLFVAGNEIYLSPASIIFKGFDIHRINKIKFLDEHIFFNDEDVIIKKKNKYQSCVAFDDSQKESVTAFCISNYEKIISSFPPDGMDYVFKERNPNLEKNGFKALMQQKTKAATIKLVEGQAMEGIKGLKGLGYGLTPSGDDFITGMLYGLHFYKNIALSKCWQGQIYHAALGSNIFVNNNLLHALQGNYNLRFKKFILSLLHNDEKEMQYALKPLLDIGATSGADLVAGFIFTLIKVNQIENSFLK